MTHTFKMVVSHRPYPNPTGRGDGLWFGQRVNKDTPTCGLNEAQRKAISKFANGRQFWGPWDKVPRGTETKCYNVFVGLFRNGKYSGRASTYHCWQVATKSTAQAGGE